MDKEIVSKFWEGVTSKDVKTKTLNIPGKNLAPNTLYLIGVTVTVRSTKVQIGSAKLGPI